MKLISKTILYYLLISLPLICIAGFFSYVLISHELRDGTDEALWKEKLNAERQIDLLKVPQAIYLSLDSLSSILPVNMDVIGSQYTEKIVFDKFEEENLNFRFLKSYYKSKNQNYEIIVAKPTLEEDELMEGLFSAFALIIMFLLLAFFIVNWLLSKALWKPFYKTLQQLNHYNIKNHTVAQFQSATTKEFKQLNLSLNKMTDKIHEDYLQQKEFTENASHEMQTPLAVIKANIGILMQSPNLKEDEMNQIQSIDNTVKKLSSLNKALLLLSKIENHQFKDENEISIVNSIQKIASNYQDLIDSKQLTLTKDFKSNINVICNQDLVDILLTNMIQNAIRHNQLNGEIKIETSLNTLEISNTGELLSIKENDLFVRFKKNDASKDSLGLGLSIVKGICNNYNFKISYSFKNNWHLFSIKFI